MNYSVRTQTIIGGILLALLVLTRGHHFAALHALPGASWAVFFLAGVYLSSKWSFPFFMGVTWLIDFAAFQWGGGSNFCFTQAYIALVAAYGALWMAGRWFAGQYRQEWSNLMLLGLSVFVGAFVCEIISSGSFYFFSGRFAEPTLTEFMGRIATYFPAYLQSIVFYVIIAATVHIAILGMTSESKDQTVKQ